MGRWGKCSVVGLCALAAGALSFATFTGCDACAVGAACPSDTFGVYAVSSCIVAVESKCASSIFNSGSCGDSSANQSPGESHGLVSPPADKSSTCDVKVTLDDGTSASFTVEFTEYQSECCGVLHDIYPPAVTLTRPLRDGGQDAADASETHDADATAADAADADATAADAADADAMAADADADASD